MLETRSTPCQSQPPTADGCGTAVAFAPEPTRRLQLGDLRNELAARGLGLLPRCLGQATDGALGILMYHRVVPVSRQASAPSWNVEPGRFRAQLRGLLDRGFCPWPLQRVLDTHRASGSVPPKTFVVTFDDGYENVFTHAWPILRELGVPATVFLAAGYLDSPEPFPFDDWAGKGSQGVGQEAWRPLTSAQCQAMLDSGLIELGTHSHWHWDFRGRPAELRSDLPLSLAVLAGKFGITRPSFATPYGRGCPKDEGPELAEAARASGVQCMLTTDSDLVRPGDDPFGWGRFTASALDTAASLAAKLDGRYSAARKAWHWLRQRPGRQRLAAAPQPSPVAAE